MKKIFIQFKMIKKKKIERLSSAHCEVVLPVSCINDLQEFLDWEMTEIFLPSFFITVAKSFGQADTVQVLHFFVLL